MKEKLIKIEEQAQIFCQARDCYVYAVEFARGSKTLRIYIDKDAGVDIEDCSEVSRQISNWLDEQDIMETNYDLEVSSPGLERPLLKAWHYDKAVGQVVAIKLYDRLGSIISVKENLAKAKNIKAKYDTVMGNLYRYITYILCKYILM